MEGGGGKFRRWSIMREGVLNFFGKSLGGVVRILHFPEGGLKTLTFPSMKFACMKFVNMKFISMKFVSMKFIKMNINYIILLFQKQAT